MNTEILKAINILTVCAMITFHEFPSTAEYNEEGGSLKQ